MNPFDFLYYGVFLALLILLVQPAGRYRERVLQGQRTLVELRPRPVEPSHL